MLTYAFQTLTHKNYTEVESETFDNIYNLFAKILIKGLNKQIKQGLYKEYVEYYENLPTIRGKINIKDSIKNKMQRKHLIASEFDELSDDNIFNRILKGTILLLMQEDTVEQNRKIKLRKLLQHFSLISTIDLKQVNWKQLHFQRNNQAYEMLMNICYFITEGLLLTTEQGTYESPVFSDENVNLLFERFVLNYYKKHLPGFKVHSPHLSWNITETLDEENNVLPRMETDIVLKNGDKRLIIDTKFYSTPLTKYDKVSSVNLYQIFSYVKTMDKEATGKVSGLLLYAQTEADKHPDFTYTIDGNRIGARTLNLNQDFSGITKELDQIVQDHFYPIQSK